MCHVYVTCLEFAQTTKNRPKLLISVQGTNFTILEVILSYRIIDRRSLFAIFSFIFPSIAWKFAISFDKQSYYNSPSFRYELVSFFVVYLPNSDWNEPQTTSSNSSPPPSIINSFTLSINDLMQIYALDRTFPSLHQQSLIWLPNELIPITQNHFKLTYFSLGLIITISSLLSPLPFLAFIILQLSKQIQKVGWRGCTSII